MKTKLSKVTLIALVSVFLFSCSSEESSFEESSSSSNTNTGTNTWIKLTATTSADVKKANYIIMMFEQPVTSTSALPTIKKQVTTDATGLAYFDLNSVVTSSTSKTYYFEAFVQDGANYVWRSVTHPSFNITKGQMITSSIIVK